MSNEIIKQQFNRQVQNFSNWPVTKNIEYLQAYFDFCGMNQHDTLLDVACGTGELAIFSAGKVASVLGVDISDQEIEFATGQAQANHLTNVRFICGDVEKIPCNPDSYSMVICKSAFHHFQNYRLVFAEMNRCCKNRGKISIQDIISYENPKVNDFFEGLEKKIDLSHHRTLSREAIVNLYHAAGLKIVNELRVEIELNFTEYLGHAVQAESSKATIESLLKTGLQDDEVQGYFGMKNDQLFFKRSVLLILGEKQ